MTRGMTMIAPCVCGGLRLLPVASRLTGCQLRRAEAATAKTTWPGSGPSGRPNRSPRSFCDCISSRQ